MQEYVKYILSSHSHVAAFEKSLGLKSGMLSRLIVSGGGEGPWDKLESGKLTLSQFRQDFSKKVSKEVSSIWGLERAPLGVATLYTMMKRRILKIDCCDKKRNSELQPCLIGRINFSQCTVL